MNCQEPACKGHVYVTYERDGTFSASCPACRRRVQGHISEASAIAGYNWKYLPRDNLRCPGGRT